MSERERERERDDTLDKITSIVVFSFVICIRRFAFVRQTIFNENVYIYEIIFLARKNCYSSV